MIVIVDDVFVVWQVGADLMQPLVELILFFLQCGSDHTTLSFYPGDTYLHATAILTMNGRYPLLPGSYHTALSLYPSDTYLHATAILTFMNGTYPLLPAVCL